MVGCSRGVHDGDGLLRVAWRSVAAIVTRVVDDLAGKTDRLEGLRRIGIDEIAHRKDTGT